VNASLDRGRWQRCNECLRSTHGIVFIAATAVESSTNRGLRRIVVSGAWIHTVLWTTHFVETGASVIIVAAPIGI